MNKYRKYISDGMAIAVPPNAGTKTQYKHILKELIDYFAKDVYKVLFADIAQDAKNKISMKRAEKYKKIRDKWYPIFNKIGNNLGSALADKTEKNAQHILKNKVNELYGKIEEYEIQKEKEIKRELIKVNSDMIKNIPKTYLRKIQKLERKSENSKTLMSGLKKLNIMTEKQAERISTDQTQKMTQMFSLINARRYGATMGRWIHVAGAKTSRQTHKQMNNQLFDLRVGMFDPDVGRNIFPSELINCRCIFQAIFEPKNF